MINLQYSDLTGQVTIPPARKSSTKPQLIKYYEKYRDNPWIATAEAIAKGYAISQIDGPLPVADVFGITYAVYDLSLIHI